METGKIALDDLAPRIRDLRACEERLRTRKVELENLLSDRRVELATSKVVAGYAADLKYAMPSAPVSMKEEKLGVLSTVQYGGR